MEVMKKIRSLKEVTESKRKNKHKKLKKGRYKKKKYKPIKFKRKKTSKKKATKKLKIKDTRTHKEKYYDYLKSDRWEIKRGKVLKRANNKCEICKMKRAYQVHHKTYKRVFRERPSDLLATCGVCHRAEHNLLTDEEVEIAVLELSKSEGYK